MLQRVHARRRNGHFVPTRTVAFWVHVAIAARHGSAPQSPLAFQVLLCLRSSKLDGPLLMRLQDEQEARAPPPLSEDTEISCLVEKVAIAGVKVRLLVRCRIGMHSGIHGVQSAQ